MPLMSQKQRHSQSDDDYFTDDDVSIPGSDNFTPVDKVHCHTNYQTSHHCQAYFTAPPTTPTHLPSHDSHDNITWTTWLDETSDTPDFGYEEDDDVHQLPFDVMGSNYVYDSADMVDHVSWCQRTQSVCTFLYWCTLTVLTPASSCRTTCCKCGSQKLTHSWLNYFGWKGQGMPPVRDVLIVKPLQKILVTASIDFSHARMFVWHANAVCWLYINIFPSIRLRFVITYSTSTSSYSQSHRLGWELTLRECHYSPWDFASNSDIYRMTHAHAPRHRLLITLWSWTSKASIQYHLIIATVTGPNHDTSNSCTPASIHQPLLIQRWLLHSISSKLSKC